MKKSEILRNGVGLYRNYGWKTNLLAIAATFLLCFGLDQLQQLMYGVRVLSGFDASAAAVPLIGFLLGIWGFTTK